MSNITVSPESYHSTNFPVPGLKPIKISWRSMENAGLKALGLPYIAPAGKGRLASWVTRNFYSTTQIVDAMISNRILKIDSTTVEFKALPGPMRLRMIVIQMIYNSGTFLVNEDTDDRTKSFLKKLWSSYDSASRNEKEMQTLFFAISGFMKERGLNAHRKFLIRRGYEAIGKPHGEFVPVMPRKNWAAFNTEKHHAINRHARSIAKEIHPYLDDVTLGPPSKFLKRFLGMVVGHLRAFEEAEIAGESVT